MPSRLSWYDHRQNAAKDFGSGRQGALRQRQQARLRFKHVCIACETRASKLKGIGPAQSPSTPPRTPTGSPAGVSKARIGSSVFGTSRSVRACRDDPSVLVERSSSGRREAGFAIIESGRQGAFSLDAAKPSYMRDRCKCQDVQFYCEGVDCYNSGGRVMLSRRDF